MIFDQNNEIWLSNWPYLVFDPGECIVQPVPFQKFSHGDIMGIRTSVRVKWWMAYQDSPVINRILTCQNTRGAGKPFEA